MSLIRYSDLVDVLKLQALMESFSDVIGIANAVIDVEGNVIAYAGWQDACTAFHRVNKETCRRCIESDTSLAAIMTSGVAYAIYKCHNGLVDAASPIIVAGEHVANVFTGQFLTEPADVEFFRQQARQFGFAETDYLAAIAKVPVLSPERVESVTRLYAQLAGMLADDGLDRINERSAAERLASVNRSLEETVAARTQALRQANEGLLERERKLTEAQSLAHIGSWERDLVHNRLTWSEEMYRIFGMPPEQFGANYEAFLDTLHPDDREMVDRAYISSLESGGLYDIEYRIIRKSDGQLRWGYARGDHERDANGEAVRFHGTVQDITERKMLERTSERERIRLQTILKTASDGIHILNHDGLLVDANEAFLNMLGYDESVIGKLSITDWSLSPWAESKARLDELTPHGGRVFFETRHRRRDGSVIDVEIGASGITIEGKDYLYAASRDITERKQQEQLRFEREKAHRDVLVREVHHRIKNNLQSVAGLLHRELGRFLELDPRLETAISQINVIAAVHGLQGSNPGEEIFLFHIIENICKSIGGILQSPVQLQVGDTNSAVQSVQLEKDEAVSIALVLNELVLNAIKHSPQGSSAPTISVTSDGEYAQIVIRNTLTGPPDFDIDTGKGIGTGLSLVRSLLPYEAAQLSYEVDTEGFMLTQITLTTPVIVVTRSGTDHDQERQAKESIEIA